MATSEQNIVLAGFMATGKTTVGRILAEKLDRVFLDVDTEIEHRTGRTIPCIFADYGESFFRAIEKGICHELCLRNNLVIALGGGAVIDEGSRDILTKTGFVVGLVANESTIEKRLAAADNRPLADTWRELLATREPIYNRLPTIIDTTDKTPETIAEEILTLWQQQSA